MRKKILITYAIAMLLGVLTGIIGSCFQLAIAGLNFLLTSFRAYSAVHHLPTGILSAIISMLMVVSAWVLVRYFAPEAAGSGIQEIEGTLRHERPIHWRRLLPVKFMGGVLAIGAKMVVGREGPTIQMGGNLGDMLGELLKIKRERRNTLIAAGSAAGLATAFNAPLAGVLFVIEEMRNEFNFNFTNFKTVGICCVMATITLHFIIGSAPVLPMAVFAIPSLHSLWLFFFFGIVAGFAGLLFNMALMHCLFITDALSQKQRIIYMLVISGFCGFFAHYLPAIVGGGYDIIEQSLTLPPSINLLVLIFLMRFITTMLCYSTGIPGGIFAPMLALGTLLGLICFHILDKLIVDFSIHPGMFAVAGMGALFASAIRSPLTGIVLVVEMTHNYSLILPLMVSCFTSTTVVQLAKNKPIYVQLLRRTLNKCKKGEA